MARDYIREELTSADIKLFQEGKSIMLNPELSDIATALNKTEKGCKINKLPLKEGKAAWRAVIEGQADMTTAGYWSCPPRSKHGVQGTIMQVVRLSDSLTGLFCDRLTVPAGKASVYPIPAIDDDAVDKRPTHFIETILQVFWMQLSDQDIDDIEQALTLRLLDRPPSAARIKRRKVIAKASAKARELRKKNIHALFHGTPPEFISEFKEGCLRLVQKMRLDDKNYIAWSELKKINPSLTTRYKNDFLALMENSKLTLSQLDSVSDDSPCKVHFSLWTGYQRIFNTPQLVMEIRNPNIHRHFMKRGGQHKEVSNELKLAAKRSGHPGTATTIGWFRIHVDDDNKICFVDEIQSESLEKALSIENDAATEFYKECNKWNIHCFATVCNWAREIGYRAAIHSRKSASSVPDKTQSNRKWNSYYRTVIKQFGLVEETIEGYPEQIWVEQ